MVAAEHEKERGNTMKNSAKLIAITLFLLFLVTGCRSLPVASDSYNQKALQFKPTPGWAGVYILRENQFVASGSHIKVFLNHKKVGMLYPKSFIYGEIMPREHSLELAEMPGAKNTSLRFKAEEGKSYFFNTKVAAGFLIGSQVIEVLSEEEGKERVKTHEHSGFNEFDAAGKDAGAVPGLNKN
jgi:hypothetical protein